VYRRPGKEFASHQAVDHSRDEYAYRDEFSGRIVSINVSGNFYNIFAMTASLRTLGPSLATLWTRRPSN
jgi:hypothetical protein